ncbi:MAG TPA: PIN domain nuclease [Acidimicrobiales bacterium]|nr:PIN domain nuclease [Acidimicrobiales bacterium]
MILIDTSAWIEFLRDTGSPVCQRVDQLLGESIACTDTVRMEVLAGARDEGQLQQLTRLLARAEMLATEPVHYDAAAQMYRTCRHNGETPRKLIDCLIAAVAVANGAPVLHQDADFDTLARHTSLTVVA